LKKETEKKMNQIDLKKQIIDAFKGEKLKDLESAQPERYASMGLDDLVLIAMVELEKRSVELSYENIYRATFILYSQSFGLPGSEFVPDISRMKSSIWHLRSNKHWITGRGAQCFSLTDKARDRVVMLHDQLKTGFSSTPVRKKSKLRRSEHLILEVLDSPAYSKFKDKQQDSITEADLCYALQGTTSTPRSLLAANLYSLKSVAEEMGDNKLSVFLDWLQNRFSTYLEK
jgi:hypothetical protein